MYDDPTDPPFLYKYDDMELTNSKLCYIDAIKKPVIKAYRMSLNNWKLPNIELNPWDMVANSVAIYGKGNLRGVVID